MPQIILRKINKNQFFHPTEGVVGVVSKILVFAVNVVQELINYSLPNDFYVLMKLTDITNSFLRNNSKAEQVEDDLGLGDKIMTGGGRLINKDGTFNIVREGNTVWTLYQNLVEISWPRFLGLTTLVYGLINGVFATLFWLIGPNALSGMENKAPFEQFTHAFFFSIQTFTTVGYGGITPQTFLADLLASFDAFVGLLAFALATGLLFARFAKPRAQIKFSKNAIIAPYGDKKSLQFRIVNLRSNKIINLTAQVTMTWLEVTPNGKKRRFQQLDLERDQVILFPLNWTLVHPIEGDSPFMDRDISDIKRMETEILVLVQGFDETFSQSVHVNSSYTCAEILTASKFVPMYYAENGQTILELDKLNDMVGADE